MDIKYTDMTDAKRNSYTRKTCICAPLLQPIVCVWNVICVPILSLPSLVHFLFMSIMNY